MPVRLQEYCLVWLWPRVSRLVWAVMAAAEEEAAAGWPSNGPVERRGNGGHEGPFDAHLRNPRIHTQTTTTICLFVC